MEFTEWQQYSQRINGIAKRIKAMQDDRAWAIAASVGIPRDCCCLHNASIDTELSGWCAVRPDRLNAAKRASHILNNWNASQLAQRISARAWAQVEH